jgi:chloramphenicol O-acetyltransferase type A
MTRPEGRREIDLKTWERSALFEFFKGFSEPYHGVCLRVDCTETFDYAKANHLSVFLSLLHRCLVAAHQVENFRTRIIGESVWVYDRIHGGSAVGRPNGTIGFGHYSFRENLHDFVQEASIELERVKARTDIERYPQPDLIRFSRRCLGSTSHPSHMRAICPTKIPRHESPLARSVRQAIAERCLFQSMCIML